MALIDLVTAARPGRPVGDRPEKDRATWYGLGSATALLVAAMALGGSLAAYLDLPAFLIVVGGTAAVTLVSFPLDEARALPGVVGDALFRRLIDPALLAERLIQIAETVRRGGALALENAVHRLDDQPFARASLTLVLDETPPDRIERLLKASLQAALDRRRCSTDLLRRAGEVAPALGLIGTLIGLVRMLGGLGNPASLGPAMAVAILATLYGAILANVVLLPLAAKLDRNGHDEALNGNLAILTALSIAHQESPRRLVETLNGILPPAARLTHYD